MLDTNIQWTLASAITTLIHLALTVLAFLDLRAAVLGGVARWRRQNAGWYAAGQCGLFLVALDHAWVGVIAMTMLPRPAGPVSGPAADAQNLLIGGEWFGAGVAVAFWMARRALASWAEEHDTEHDPRRE